MLIGEHEGIRLHGGEQVDGALAEIGEPAALAPAATACLDGGMGQTRGFYVDTVERTTTADREAVWRVLEGIGGQRGWYSTDALWFARATANRLHLPPSRLRHREDPDRLAEGERLDWWTVEALQPHERLRLRSVVRMPGQAWLDVCLDQGDRGNLIYRQTTVFRPDGAAGRGYWYAMLVPHRVVFARLAGDILRHAEG